MTERSAESGIAFSVVIPTYNRARMVADAVESALSQTYPPVEIIVVDDESTDGTPEALRSQFKNSLVRVLSVPHGGASAARNRGVQVAVGEYIAFLDSDDLFHRDKLEKYRIAIRQNPSSALFHSYWDELNLETGVKQVNETTVDGDARHELLMFGRIATPTVVAKRDRILQAGGFDEEMFLVEDYDLWCRLCSLGPLTLIPESLTTVRIHGGNSTREPGPILRNQIKMINRYFESCCTDGLNPKKSYIANSLYWVAYLYLIGGEYPRAVGLFSKAWAYDWKHNRARCALMIVRAIKALVGKRLHTWLGRWRTPGTNSI